MNRRILSAGVVLFASVSATLSFAQDHRVEISPFVGYTFSNGFRVDPNSILGIVVDEISPTSGASYGFQVGFFASDNVEIGFQWARQDSRVELKGSGRKEEIADLSVDNYHGMFTYHFGYSRDTVRPYIFGGLGATSYSPGDFMGRPIDGDTRFSFTWGGGVRTYLSNNVGLNFVGRWTPTYIRSDPAGVWCSPYWPFACWVVQSDEFSNQFELAAGVTFRF